MINKVCTNDYNINNINKLNNNNYSRNNNNYNNKYNNNNCLYHNSNNSNGNFSNYNINKERSNNIQSFVVPRKTNISSANPKKKLDCSFGCPENNRNPPSKSNNYNRLYSGNKNINKSSFHGSTNSNCNLVNRSSNLNNYDNMKNRQRNTKDRGEDYNYW